MDGIVNNASVYSIELAWGGKLPGMGDFVWSNGYTSLRTQLDNWLLTGMQQFRSILSSSWESSFDQAPMWNFIVPANMLGPGCVAGCISPSCDRIGRRFPFAVTYGLSANAPDWYLSEVMNAIPVLLTRTGILLFNGIRRQWPRETLATLIAQALINWEKETLSPVVEQAEASEQNSDSVILNVLFEKNKYNSGQDNIFPGGSKSNDKQDISAIYNSRFSSLPWSNVTTSLIAGSATSFWWTNGAGGAALKTFTYREHLDGTLMTWLFGR